MKQEPSPQKPPDDRRNADQGSLFLLVLVLMAAAGGLTFALVLPSWKPIHNMERQPYYKPYEPTEMFTDGMSERPLESGVVPRPAAQSPGIPYIAVRAPGPAGYPDIARSGNIPLPVTSELLARGQERYNIYCSMCHGALGEGNGMVVQRGLYPPPSYHNDRLRKLPDSHYYDVITNGFGTMFSYSERVAPEDRWAIVAYIRALQIAVQQSPELSAQLQKPAGVRP